MSRIEELSTGQIFKEGIGNAALHVTEIDRNGNIKECSGTSIPADGVTYLPNKGFAPGCVFEKTDAAYGQYPRWINLGSSTSCKFRPFGPVMGYGFLTGGGPVTSLGADTAESISLQGIIMDSDIAVVGHEVSNDSDTIVAAIANEGSIDLTLSVDPSTAHGYVYGVMRDKCLPAFDIVAAGTHVTTGGAAAEAITVTGVLATDIAFASYSVTDDSDVIAKVVCTANTVTVTCSVDPGATHSIDYMVLRPKGDFQPSHYIVGAAVHTTTAAVGATNDITITGATSGDVVLAGYAGTNDTDTIVSAAVSAANTVTVTMSADPSTAHKIWCVVLRAY